MSLGLSIQRPYSITSLPRPVNQSTGRYVVGDVHGGTPGSRKRKRAELAVGIDGEGLNLYDIQESRLITSYAIPPQYSFTCAPCSTRIKNKDNSTIIRRSYISTVDDRSRITLFKDVTEEEQTGESTTIVHELEASEFPIVYMNTLCSRDSVSDLLIVRKDGQIKCLDGEKLNEIWTSSTNTIGRVDGTSNHGGHDVLYTQLTDAYAASKGLLRGLSGVLSGVPGEITAEVNNLDILVLITHSVSNQGLNPRTLHVLALPQPTTTSNGLKARSHSLQSLLSTNFPSTITHTKKRNSTFSLHAPTGVLYELCGEILTSIDLVNAIPKVQKMRLTKSAQSFLRLSSTAIVTSATDSVDFYNPKYMSIQTTFNPSAIGGADSKTQKRKSLDSDMPVGCRSWKLLSYFSKLDLIVGIAGSELVALQVETSQERPAKRRASGLLRDSLGCGMRSQKIARCNKSALSNTIFSDYLAVLFDEDWASGKAALDESVRSDNVDQFDDLMAKYFRITTKQSPKEGPASWIWPQPGEDYPEVDQRSVLYALGQIFCWNKSSRSNNSLSYSEKDGYHLTITFYPQNTFIWLIETGNLTITNIELSLKKYRGFSELPHLPAGELVSAIAAIDPEMSLLLSVLSKSSLNAYELLHAIRVLMESLDIFNERSSSVQPLTNGEPMDGLVNGDAEVQIEKEQAAAERAIEAAEYHLGHGSSTRGQALSMALEKLYTYPGSDVVKALRDAFTTDKIVSLVLLLRHELIRGSWTSRYVDKDQKEDEVENEADSPNNSIVMISNLLNYCIDAMGTGGWLLADSALIDGMQYEAEDLIGSLKLEVSAALQGIDEATYIKGLTGEMLRFAKANAIPAKNKSKGTDNSFGRARAPLPILLPAKTSALLPVGLKAGVQISQIRIGAGGELKARSKRDIGRLKSQQVGKYSLERIVI